MTDLSSFAAELAWFRQKVAQFDVVTGERIRKLINESPFNYLSETIREAIARQLEASFDVKQTTGSAIREQTFRPWLKENKANIDFYYWSRLQRYLLETGQLPPAVTNTLDTVTDEVLDYVGNPVEGTSWLRRGMVLGHVQSGKTSNYSALICKAADAGFRVIVLLAGSTNLLRRQTQERIDEAFIGRRAIFGLQQMVQYIGVAQFVREGDPRRTPLYGTSIDSDFTIHNARNYGVPLSGIREPIIFVTKKNITTLTNLRTWFMEMHPSGQIPYPMLLIDDEADNASINTAEDPEKTTRINGAIRSILHLFMKASYVGYTATPFANIFINPNTNDEMLKEDLFPADFIKSLDPPTNYVGPHRVFSEKGDLRDTMVQTVDDYQEILPLKHKNGHEVHGLPPSLEEAVRIFILSRAIRILRGDGAKHSSMMVNVSRFNSVQDAVRGQIYRYFELLRHAINIHAGLGKRGLDDAHISALAEDFTREFAGAGVQWEEIQSHLPAAAASISIRTVNMRGGKLDYSRNKETGLHVLAIGGLALSRGLTLEGLTVSYILRNASAYDTLMQMGRWFGYRPRYEDLCRLYITEESRDYYEHISEVTEELRHEINRMEHLGMTPRDFGLKVREHPEAIRITAANKMRNAKRITLAQDLQTRHIEGHTIYNSTEKNEKNRKLIARFIGDLGEPHVGKNIQTRGAYVWSDIGARKVLQFLETFQLPPRNFELCANFEADDGGAPRSLVQDYIFDRLTSELKCWDVVLPQLLTPRMGHGPEEIASGIEINCRERQGDLSGAGEFFRISGSKQRVADREDAALGLDKDLAESVSPRTDREFNSRRSKPLLILHAFHPKRMKDEVGRLEFTEKELCVTISICFPKSDIAPQERTYQANLVWLQSMQDDVEFDEDAGDIE